MILRFLFATLLLLSSVKSFADSANVQYYERSNSMLYDTAESVGLEDSLSPEFKEWMMTLGYSYKSSPLLLKSENNQKTYSSVISQFQTLNFGAGYRLNSHWRIGFTSALVGSKMNNEQKFNLNDTNLRLHYRHDLTSTTAWGLHLLASTPTGNTQTYTSDDGIGLGIGAAFEQNLKLLQYVANLTYLENPSAKDPTDINLDQRKRLMLNLSGLMPLTAKWSATADFDKTWTLPIKTVFNPNELRAGLRYSENPNWAFFGGLGADSVTSEEPLELRLYAGLKFSPTKDDKPQSAHTEPTVKKEITDPKCYDVDKIYNGYQSTIHFPNNQDIISASSREELSLLIQFTKDHVYKISHVTVDGHASKPGSDAYNLKLSKKRAQRMSKILLDLGIDKKLLEFDGKGKKQLISYGNDEADHKLNRRVEVKVWIKELRKECKR